MIREIRDASFADHGSAGEPFKATLAPLGIELDGLSTLPEDRGDYLVAARLPEQGGTLEWKGDVGLSVVDCHLLQRSQAGEPREEFLDQFRNRILE